MTSGTMGQWHPIQRKLHPTAALELMDLLAFVRLGQSITRSTSGICIQYAQMAMHTHMMTNAPRYAATPPLSTKLRSTVSERTKTTFWFESVLQIPAMNG